MEPDSFIEENERILNEYPAHRSEQDEDLEKLMLTTQPRVMYPTSHLLDAIRKPNHKLHGILIHGTASIGIEEYNNPFLLPSLAMCMCILDDGSEPC